MGLLGFQGYGLKTAGAVVKYGRPIQVLSDLQLHTVENFRKYVPVQADRLLIHGSLGFGAHHPAVQNFYEQAAKSFEKVFVVPKLKSLDGYSVPKLDNVKLMDTNVMIVDPCTAIVRCPPVTNQLMDTLLDQCVDMDLSVVLVDETWHCDSNQLLDFYGSYIRGIVRPNLWNVSYYKLVNGTRYVTWNPRSFGSKKTVPVLW